jgi:hypothetical protein
MVWLYSTIGTYVSEQGKYIGGFYNGHFHGDGELHVKGGKFVGEIFVAFGGLSHDSDN